MLQQQNATNTPQLQFLVWERTKNNTTHPAVQAEFQLLQQRFPGKQEITLDDYAVYFQICRRYAPEHFKNQNIPHKRIGRRILISLYDFAVFLAQHKYTECNRQAYIPVNTDMKARRGFAQRRNP